MKPSDRPKTAFTVAVSSSANVNIHAHSWYVGEGSNVLVFCDFVSTGDGEYDYESVQTRAFGPNAWEQVFTA